jgi:hypothetical protein
MFEKAHMPTVMQLIDLSMEHDLPLDTPNYTLTSLENETWLDKPIANYTGVYGFANGYCASMGRLPPLTTEILMLISVLVLCGKGINEIGLFGDQILNFFRMKNFLSMSVVDREDRKALHVALTTPAKAVEMSAITPCSTALIVLLVMLPHLTLQCFITYVGAKYLITSRSLLRLVKGSLKVYFIIKFDGFLFKAYTADNFKKLVKGACFKIKHKEERFPVWGWWQSFVKIVLQFIIAVVLAYLFVNVQFPGPTSLGRKCQEYREHFNMTAKNFSGRVPCLGDSCGNAFVFSDPTTWDEFWRS